MNITTITTTKPNSICALFVAHNEERSRRWNFLAFVIIVASRSSSSTTGRTNAAAADDDDELVISVPLSLFFLSLSLRENRKVERERWEETANSLSYSFFFGCVHCGVMLVLKLFFAFFPQRLCLPLPVAAPTDLSICALLPSLKSAFF